MCFLCEKCFFHTSVLFLSIVFKYCFFLLTDLIVSVKDVYWMYNLFKKNELELEIYTFHMKINVICIHMKQFNKSIFIYS